MDGLLEAANAGVPLQEIVGPFVRELTWENVVKLFRTAYRLIEQHCGGSKPSDGGWWTAFDELWDTILTDVSRWILQRGGWVRITYRHYTHILISGTTTNLRTNLRSCASVHAIHTNTNVTTPTPLTTLKHCFP